MKNSIVFAALIIALPTLSACGGTVRKGSAATVHTIPTCDARTALQTARANNGTPYDFEEKLIETPCALSSHPTLEDAKLVWARAEFLLVLLDSFQPWSPGIHNAHDQAKSDALDRSITVLYLVLQWENTGRQPATWRKEQDAFAAAAEKANTGPGRVLTNGGKWRTADVANIAP